MSSSSEVWRDCATWLEKCQVIPSDHRLMKRSEARFVDLACFLKDGVVLCCLLNRLYPNSIDPRLFSQRPQHSQYLCRKNFRVFGEACRNVFGLSESDLFKPEELYEPKDFEKVVQTLAKLSQTKLALKAVTSSFFVGSNREIETDSSKETDNQRDADIYDSTVECIYETFGDEEQDIYDVLMHDQVPPPTVKKSTSNSRKDMCINELILTEKKYVDVLHLIQQHFMEPLFPVLEPNDYEKLFLKIEELAEIHESFYENLCLTTDSSAEGFLRKTTSDCFIMWKEKFLIYGEFCSNLSYAQDLIETLSNSSPQIKAAIEKCQLTATGGKFLFRDLLPVPMQRVLKYPLLLQEMVKATEPTDPENRMLQRALEEMKDLSLYVNEVKRDNETLQLINEIEKNIINLEMPENIRLKDYGRLLMDGSLKVKSKNDKTKPRNVFVFDKVVVLCTPKGDVNEYKDCIIIAHYSLDDALPIKEIRDRAFTHGFVLRNNADPGTYYAFGAKSKDLRQKWIDVFELARSNINPVGANDNGHQFSMTSYDKPTICDVCRKLLRGVFFQGYKCKKTHMSAHKECIPRASSMNGPPTSMIPGRRPSVTTLATIGRVKALQSFSGSSTSSGTTDSERSQLAFEKDMEFDLISDLGKLWTGRIGNKVGCFPKHCVTVVQDFRQEKRHSDEPVADVISRFPKNMRTKRRNTEPALPLCPPRLLRESGNCLENYPWYLGDLSRDDASVRLQYRPNGTFLVRQSDRGGFALSLVFDGPRHIKIRESEGNFSLGGKISFASIPDLIDHFKKTSLEVSFSEITTSLLFPIKELRVHSLQEADDETQYCEAIYDYSATQTDQISFHVDDRILIINKSLESEGWWKGKLNGKIGYFPYSYVREI